MRGVEERRGDRVGDLETDVDKRKTKLINDLRSLRKETDKRGEGEMKMGGMRFEGYQEKEERRGTSGSTMMFHSATGPMLPVPTAPPR